MSTQQQIDIIMSQSVWKIYFGAVLQDIREPNWREEEQEEEAPKCLYHKTCGNDADFKTMNGKIDGNKSESWGELAYGNNHLYNWNLCGICFKEESGEDDEEEEEETISWCEVGEHHVSKDDMWKDFADCKNCVSEKEMMERQEEN